MLQVASQNTLAAMEGALRRAAQQNDATVLSVMHVGQHLQETTPGGDDAFVFCICHSELYSALLAGDIRMSTFLPCRIAAYSRGGQVFLETVSPVNFCRLLNRPDLAPLAGPLDDLLRKVMEEAAKPAAEASQAALGAHRGGLGATEEQMNLRGAIPQRIDCRGSKIEELGGTGEHDAKGG